MLWGLVRLRIFASDRYIFVRLKDCYRTVCGLPSLVKDGVLTFKSIIDQMMSMVYKSCSELKGRWRRIPSASFDRYSR